MQIKIKKLRENATIPTRGSASAAGYDLYACLDAPVTVAPHATAMIGTGLSLAVPEGYFGAVFARRGLASKKGLEMTSGFRALIISTYRFSALGPVPWPR